MRMKKLLLMLVVIALLGALFVSTAFAGSKGGGNFCPGRNNSCPSGGGGGGNGTMTVTMVAGAAPSATSTPSWAFRCA